MHPGTVSAVCFAFAAMASVRAQVPEWRRLPVLTSTATKRLDFDAARERMVLFESSGWGDVARTWEWVGDNWSLRRTANTPQPRQDFGFAYDPVRHCCVMFGGSTRYYWGATRLADTWDYNGEDWIQRFPANTPPAQTAPGMAFDYANRKILMFGGITAGASGAWLFDGTNWTVTTTGPTYAYQLAFASDPVRRRIVALATQTMEWDGATWQTIPSVHSPIAVSRRCMTYVASRGTIVAHGGYQATSTYPMTTDLWEWNGIDWSQIPNGPAPTRAEHSLANDPIRNRLFTVGGWNHDGSATDTLQWDGTNWTRSPDALGQDLVLGSTFDPTRSRTVAITELPSSRATSPLRVIEWDGTTWHYASAPPGMEDSLGIAFDLARMRLVAVGKDAAGALFTWERLGTTWAPALPTPTLPVSGSVLYHALRAKVMVCSRTSLSEWNGTTWTQAGPGPGNGWENAVYDAARNAIVVPTGFVGGALLTSTWDGVSWTQHVPVGSPPTRIAYMPQFGGAPSLGYDEARQRVVLFGGRDPVMGPTPDDFHRFLDDLWEWDGTTWTQRLLPHAPTPREGAVLAFDRARQQLLVIGGNRHEYNGAYLLFADIWALDSATAATVTTLGPGCGGPQLPHLVPAASHPGQASFTVDLHRAPPDAPSLFLFALNSGTLPLGGGCTSFVPQPDLVVFRATNPNGFASTHTAIPLALQGFSFAAQAAVLDPSAPAGCALTEGLRVTIGR